MNKIIGLGFLAAGLVASAFAANRVGPVSQYGQLQAGKNSSGKGQIYGSCKGVTSGNEVAVQGMSFFWSGAGEGNGADFWTDDVVSGLVSRQNIELVRAPMSVDETGWGGSDHYFKDESTYQGIMDRMVQSAIKNDIYVLIDFHSHCAENSTENAKKFFGRMAEKWGAYDNVIFEIYNEPVSSGCSKSWIDLNGAKSYWSSSIKPYAESVIDTIRKHSDNLIVVGTPYFDQYPNAALISPLNKTNVAYTFHYYSGKDDNQHTISSQGANAVAAMNGGLSVFVTEWGNSAPSGGENMNNADFDSTSSLAWYNWMVQNKLSGANWAVTKKNETASYFTTAGAWNYSMSGSWTNDFVFANNPKSYTACDGSTVPVNSSSSDAASSSSFVVSEATLIDDFEDGDEVAYTGAKDKWFAFTDVNDKGASTISNTKGAETYNVVYAADNGSSYMGALKNISLEQGDNEYDPYVNMGLSFESGLPGCKTISYKYKGAGHNLKAVMSGDEDGELSKYDYHKTEVSGSTSWKTASVPVNSLMQDGWGEILTLDVAKIANIQWEVKGTASSNYLYIDDVACDGITVVRPASSSSAKSSSSSAASSSSSVPTVSSSSEKQEQSSSSAEPVVSSSSEEIVVSSSSKETVESSSSEIFESSSSEEPQQSSTSVVPEESSSSAEPVVSSSSEEIVVSSSSEEIVVSSSSEEAVESSSSEEILVVVSGDLEQSVIQKSGIEAITISGVESYTRNTYNIYWLNFEKKGNVLTISGASPQHFETGSYSETFTVNGTTYTIKLEVSASVASSSSSESDEKSSSSTVVECSSSIVPETSSSAQPESSSSADDDTRMASVAASTFKMGFAGNVLTLNSLKTASYKIQVFDMMGHAVVNQRETFGGSFSLNLEHLNQGNYLVRVSGGNMTRSSRISIR